MFPKFIEINHITAVAANGPSGSSLHGPNSIYQHTNQSVTQLPLFKSQQRRKDNISQNSIKKETIFRISKQSEPVKATIFDERTDMLTM